MPVAATAAPIILAPANVVGSSGFYTLCCTFQPGNILDQQTGTVTESFGGGYWLNPDNGPANAYITVKLGTGAVALSSLELYNTHNGPYGDRGTGDFSIYGSNFVSGGQLVAPTLILSGTLAAQSVAGPTVAQTFAASGTYRYLSFNPTSVASANATCCGANVFGLNELRVVGTATVPEPQSWILLIAGFGLVGAAMRRRAMLAG
ncbi:MAG: PEP-CTERM sorting domain-containing protein [Sandarakinorhabdus sp.]|nr:PEP-CTERM sorting domain-containing protein [Sandarakinorhabdus sp.]